jgi:riboflavin synthase
MFTGLVQHQGQMIRLAKSNPAVLTLSADLPDTVRIGDSVAVNGACLTVIDIKGSQYSFNVSEETLRLSTFDDLPPRYPLNLELAMCLGDRLGGHLVSGHLDGTARVKTIRPQAGSTTFDFVFTDRDWPRQMIPKGSVCVNGISLTLSAVTGMEFRIDVIPHTLATTNLSSLRIGERVQIELDLIGKYLYNFHLRKE